MKNCSSINIKSLSRKFVFCISFASVLIIANTVAYASVTNGTIDTTYKFAKVCDSANCSASSTINFLPSGSTAITIADADSTTANVSGYAWGATLGWIKMNPSNNSPVKVNISTGAMSGNAWNDTSGYINFAPTGQGVTINANGELNGFAWSGGKNGGWIKFDCTGGSTATCVKTDWRPTAGRPVVPSGGGGGGGGGGGVVFPITQPTGSTTTTNSAATQTGPQNQKNGDYTNSYRADINDSGVIDLFDYNSLMVNWNKVINLGTSTVKLDKCKVANVADINCDGNVNLLDFNIIMIFWGQKVRLGGV